MFGRSFERDEREKRGFARSGAAKLWFFERPNFGPSKPRGPFEGLGHFRKTDNVLLQNLKWPLMSVRTITSDVL